MKCPEHLVFKSRILWVWMYWRDVRRELIPLRVWLNPLNYEISIRLRLRDPIITVNREGRAIRAFFWRAKQSIRAALRAVGGA